MHVVCWMVRGGVLWAGSGGGRKRASASEGVAGGWVGLGGSSFIPPTSFLSCCAADVDIRTSWTKERVAGQYSCNLSLYLIHPFSIHTSLIRASSHPYFTLPTQEVFGSRVCYTPRIRRAVRASNQVEPAARLAARGAHSLLRMRTSSYRPRVFRCCCCCSSRT